VAQPNRDDRPLEVEDYVDEAKPRSKSSSTTKVVLVTLVVGTLVLCCGGLGFLGLMGYQVSKNAKVTVATTPAQKQQIARSIARIDLPEGYEPTEAFESAIMGIDMKLVTYQPADQPNTRLMLMRNSMLPANPSEAERRAMLDQMRAQTGAGQRGRVLDTEVVELLIGDTKVPFQLQTIEEPQGKVKQLIGVVPLEDGSVMVILRMAEEDFDLDKAKELLSTLRKGEESDDVETITEPPAQAQPEAVGPDANAPGATPEAEAADDAPQGNDPARDGAPE
jgi:hypothetical protein